MKKVRPVALVRCKLHSKSEFVEFIAGRIQLDLYRAASGRIFIGKVIIEPMVEGLSAEQHLPFRRRMISRMERLIPPLMIWAILFPLLTGIFYGEGWARLLLLGGVGLSLAALIHTLTVNRPINLRFLRWDAAEQPADFTHTVSKWSRYDRVRTAH